MEKSDFFILKENSCDAQNGVKWSSVATRNPVLLFACSSNSDVIFLFKVLKN